VYVDVYSAVPFTGWPPLRLGKISSNGLLMLDAKDAGRREA